MTGWADYHRLSQVRQLLRQCYGGREAGEPGPLGYSRTGRLRQTPPTFIPTDGMTKKNRQCCVMFHPLWLFKYQRCPYIILGHLEWTKKFRKKGTHYTFCMTWTQELVLLPAGSESYRQWLYCFLFSRMCFSSAFRSWVRPRLKTSVPRWVDEAQRGCADLFDDTAWIFFSLQGWLRLMFILIFIVLFFLHYYTFFCCYLSGVWWNSQTYIFTVIGNSAVETYRSDFVGYSGLTSIKIFIYRHYTCGFYHKARGVD